MAIVRRNVFLTCSAIAIAVAALALHELGGPGETRPGPPESRSAGAQREVVPERDATMPAAAGSPEPIVKGTSVGAKVGERVRSFDGESDLWAFAIGALDSSNSAEIFEAHRGAQECIGLAGMLNDLGVFAAGAGGLVKGPLTSERQLAIQSLRERCMGFARGSIEDSRALVDKLRRRGDQLQSTEFTDARSGGNSSDEMRRMQSLLFSASPAAKEAALPMLLLHLDRVDGVTNPGDRRSTVSGAAALLALCDLGKDCSARGLSAQLQCGLTGKCAGDLWDGWQDGLTAAEVEAVHRRRQAIVAAVTARNLGLIGR